MKNLAILIDKLGYTQKAKKICEELNKISPDYNPVLFTAEYGAVPVKTNFPIMEMVKCYDYKAIFIATDFYTVQVMNNCLFPMKKYFYEWDKESLYFPFSFSHLQGIYNNPSIDLLARNQYRFDILSNTWKTPTAIMHEFDFKQLERLL